MGQLSRVITIKGGVGERHLVGGGGIFGNTSGESEGMFVFRPDVESYK